MIEKEQKVIKLRERITNEVLKFVEGKVLTKPIDLNDFRRPENNNWLSIERYGWAIDIEGTEQYGLDRLDIAIETRDRTFLDSIVPFGLVKIDNTKELFFIPLHKGSMKQPYGEIALSDKLKLFEIKQIHLPCRTVIFKDREEDYIGKILYESVRFNRLNWERFLEEQDSVLPSWAKSTIKTGLYAQPFLRTPWYRLVMQW